VIKKDLFGVMSYWADIERAGRRISKIRPVAARPPRYQYWGYPPGGSVRVHKLGQAQKFRLKLGELHEENGILKAVRSMKAGVQFRDFPEIAQAEEWIAESDRWGPLQAAEPKSQRAWNARFGSK
jgi:hypothetical protein